LLNNQPMGFYSPATIVKDAQRHGLKLLPIDVTKSEWNCTLESVPSTRYSVPSANPAAERRQNTAHGANRGIAVSIDGQAPKGRKNIALEVEGSPHSQLTTRDSELETIALRMGLRYVRGLREEAARSLLLERIRAPFTSIHDLTRRVPELRKDELTTLAAIGALNSVASTQYPVLSKSFVMPTTERTRGIEEFRLDSALSTRYSVLNNSKPATRNSKLALHRRDALWQVERAARASGPLLEQHAEADVPSPLQPMSHEERLVADFHGTGLTVGPHPMAYRREWLNAMGIRRASELRNLPTGKRIRIGGCVITRQRPGTAKGFVFLSLEDETGVANAIVRPDLFHQNRLLLTSERFLAIEGILQNQDNVISVRAERVQPLFVTKAETASHDFH